MVMELTAINNKMSVEEKKPRIIITCKHCQKSQTYTMRSKTIPKRPKTQCSSCEKWIYIDKSLLVKKDQIEDDQKPNDQKSIKRATKPVELLKQTEIEQLSSLTKTDQMTKPKENKLNSKQTTEIQLLGMSISLDKIIQIARETLENRRNLTKGMKYYLNSWESRYERYKIDKPENFLIDEFESMKGTLTFLEKIKKINEGLKNATNRT